MLQEAGVGVALGGPGLGTARLPGADGRAPATAPQPCGPARHAARLFEAQDAGATEDGLRRIAAQALGEVHFRDGGRRAQGLEVEFTDIEQVDFGL